MGFAVHEPGITFRSPPFKSPPTLRTLMAAGCFCLYFRAMAEKGVTHSSVVLVPVSPVITLVAINCPGGQTSALAAESSFFPSGVPGFFRPAWSFVPPDCRRINNSPSVSGTFVAVSSLFGAWSDSALDEVGEEAQPETSNAKTQAIAIKTFILNSVIRASSENSHHHPDRQFEFKKIDPLAQKAIQTS